jgi:lysine/ornithine N-monooxygenase
MDDPLTSIILYVIITIVITLIFREIVCWYWKINEMLSVLKQIRDLLSLMASESENKKEKIDYIKNSKSIEKNDEKAISDKINIKYENIKKQIISEIAESLNSKEELRILNSLAELSYSKLQNMRNNSDGFSETQLKVFNLVFNSAQRHLFESSN